MNPDSDMRLFYQLKTGAANKIRQSHPELTHDEIDGRASYWARKKMKKEDTRPFGAEPPPKQLPPVIDKRDAEIARLNKLVERLEDELDRITR